MKNKLLFTMFSLLLTFILLSCQSTLDPGQEVQSQLSSNDGLTKATTFRSKEVIEEYWFLSGECLGEMLHIPLNPFKILLRLFIRTLPQFHLQKHCR